MQPEITHGLGPYGKQTGREYLAAYYRQIVNIDDNIGRMLLTLQQRGLTDDTIVIFTSDHGDMMGQNGLWAKEKIHYSSAGVPLIVRWPAGIEAGQRINALVDSSVDTLPTILQACSLPIDPGIQGISYLPLARKQVEHTRDSVFYEVIGWRGREIEPYIPLRGVRTKQHVYLRQQLEGQGDYDHITGPLLYDRIQDPYELTNMLPNDSCTNICRELNKRIERHMHETQDDWSIHAGDWPAPGYVTGWEGLEEAKRLIKTAVPDPVLARWAGRVDRSADKPSVLNG